MLVSLAIRAVRELHIGIRQETIDIVRSLGHFARGGQQLFLGRAEHMGAAAAEGCLGAQRRCRDGQRHDDGGNQFQTL